MPRWSASIRTTPNTSTPSSTAPCTARPPETPAPSPRWLPPAYQGRYTFDANFPAVGNKGSNAYDPDTVYVNSGPNVQVLTVSSANGFGSFRLRFNNGLTGLLFVNSPTLGSNIQTALNALP